MQLLRGEETKNKGNLTGERSPVSEDGGEISFSDYPETNKKERERKQQGSIQKQRLKLKKKKGG
jgi:hypothetical protein